MSKKLTPLESLQEIKLGYICEQGAINEFALGENERLMFNTIAIALIEYAEIQKVLDDFGIYNTMNLIDTLKNIQFLEKQNTINSKKLKAFDLLIKKLDMETLLHWLKEHSTDEEFELLKETLL